VPLTEAEKKKIGIPKDGLALRVSMFFRGRPEGPSAGLRLNDVLVEVDGIRRVMTTRQMQTHFQMSRNYGDKVPLVVRRGKEELKLTLTLPDGPARLE
jgi:S1-C subfamily serine protease